MSIWSLVYEGFNPDEEGLREALCTLGNGYFCTRGANPEATADGIHYPGTYLAGGYNRLKTEIKGKTIENEDLVNMPNWLPLTFRFDDGPWFNLQDFQIISYRQELDMKRGILRRLIRFRDDRNRETHLSETRFVHMRARHIAALQTTIAPENWSGRIEVQCALDGRIVNAGVERYKDLNSRHLDYLETSEVDEETIYLKVRTVQSRIELAQAARCRIYVDNDLQTLTRRTVSEPGYIAQRFSLEVSPTNAVTIQKIIGLSTSRDDGISECGLQAKKCVRNVYDFSQLMESHVLAWKHLWQRFDVEFEHERHPDENERAEMILHLHIFHLLQTTSINTMDIDIGVPSRGWHGEAYRGHILWDELFIFPILNLRLPAITKALLMYRYRRLDEARFNARKVGCRGAMYPWQSGSSGREESQEIHLNPKSGRWIADNSQLQRHVNAAIAFNIWQYYQVTDDKEFLSHYGAEMILEIARFWASISTYNSKLNRYEIHGVMGPDEYHEGYPWEEQPGLSNNAYTNIMAVWVLNRAVEILHHFLPEDRKKEICETLDIQADEISLWMDISRKMRIVFHDDGIISQFEHYERLEELDWEGLRKRYGDIQRLDRILEAQNDTPNRYKASKQADVLMLFYLFSAEELREIFDRLDYPFQYETIPKNIDYYIQRTSHGSTLSRVVHAWVLARQDREKSWKLFREALQSDVIDIQGGTTPEGIHLGAMAGTADLIKRGYTGIEPRGDALRFNPCLPEELGRLSMQVRYRGHTLELDFMSNKMKVNALHAAEGPITVAVKEKAFELKAGESKEIAF